MLIIRYSANPYSDHWKHSHCPLNSCNAERRHDLSETVIYPRFKRFRRCYTNCIYLTILRMLLTLRCTRMIEKIPQIHENSMAERPIWKFIYCPRMRVLLYSLLFIADKAYKKRSFFVSCNEEQIYRSTVQKHHNLFIVLVKKTEPVNVSVRIIIRDVLNSEYITQKKIC